jgi:hypothetical protein
VKHASAGGVELAEYPGRIFHFSSVGGSMADLMARILGESNRLRKEQAVRRSCADQVPSGSVYKNARARAREASPGNPSSLPESARSPGLHLRLHASLRLHAGLCAGLRAGLRAGPISGSVSISTSVPVSGPVSVSVSGSGSVSGPGLGPIFVSVPVFFVFFFNPGSLPDAACCFLLFCV